MMLPITEVRHIMDNLETTASRIVELAQHSQFGPFFLGPIPEDRLRAAERELGVMFSGSYRAYLLYLGGAKMFGYNFDGLPDAILSEDADLHYVSIILHFPGDHTYHAARLSSLSAAA